MPSIIFKHRSWIFGILLFLIICIISYFSRWIFVYQFEPEYWENFYYESQWNIPNSERVISDEGVYRYIGYRLVNGENPFNVDYWVPPLGKFLYGVSAKYLHNPYFTSFSFYLFALLIFGLISKEVFKSTMTRWLVIYLFALNPLLIEQLWQTMLDLPMTVFLILSIYFLFLAFKDTSNKFTVMSGIALGLMAGTKPAYFVPMIAIVSMCWLYIYKGILSWVYFLPSIVAGYVMAYFSYFIRHPNPIPWIRLHQKIIDFQKNNHGSHDWFNIFRTIFTGQYRGFWEGAKTYTPVGWSITLPIGTVGLLYLLIEKMRKNAVDNRIMFLVALSLGYIIMNLTIDFWPRYLMPLIPILTLITGYIFRNKPWVLGILIICLLPSLYFLLFPAPTEFLDRFNTNHNSGLHRETYRMLTTGTRERISEAEWKSLSSQSVQSDIDYFLDNSTAILTKENNQWKLEWK